MAGVTDVDPTCTEGGVLARYCGLGPDQITVPPTYRDPRTASIYKTSLGEAQIKYYDYSAPSTTDINYWVVCPVPNSNFGFSTDQWCRFMAVHTGTVFHWPVPIINPDSKAGDGFAEFKTMGGLDGHVAITTYGIRQAEELLSEREKAGNPRIAGIVVFSDQELREQLEALLGDLRRQLDEAHLGRDERADAESDLDSAGCQLRATRPNRGVIHSALRRIRDSAGRWSLNAATIIPALDVVLRRLGH